MRESKSLALPLGYTPVFLHRLPAALRLPTSHQELGNYTSRLILSFLRFLARWPGWYGIAVLPCFSASASIRRHSLWSPLTGHLCRISPVSTVTPLVYTPLVTPFRVGRDGWESNPPKRFWRPPRQPWNIRPYVCLSFQTVTAACRLPAVGPHRYTFLLPCRAHLRATRL